MSTPGLISVFGWRICRITGKSCSLIAPVAGAVARSSTAVKRPRPSGGRYRTNRATTSRKTRIAANPTSIFARMVATARCGTNRAGAPNSTDGPDGESEESCRLQRRHA